MPDDTASAPRLQRLAAGGVTLQVAVQGQGPLVLLCHGWPEGWRSWRAQMAALAAAGWTAAAPDMRGFGGSDAPDSPEQYTLLHIVGDLVALVKALGFDSAVLVGHDWGAPAVWHAALLRPDLFRAVVGMSVPYAPPSRTDLLTALERQGVHDFYIQYFQTPGVAEAELERDVDDTLRRVLYAGSGDAPRSRASFGRLGEGRGFLDRQPRPEVLPPWLTEAELAEEVAEYRRTGFRGGLNWYRALRRNSELLAPWHGAPIRQPSLFIAGELDAVLRFPASAAQIERYPTTLPGLRGCHILPGAGHWVQRERAAEVSRRVVEFVAGL